MMPFPISHQFNLYQESAPINMELTATVDPDVRQNRSREQPQEQTARGRDAHQK